MITMSLPLDLSQSMEIRFVELVSLRRDALQLPTTGQLLYDPSHQYQVQVYVW